MTPRTDVHQHLLPPFYRDALRTAGITEAGGRALPGWSPEQALDFMGNAGVTAAVLSVSTPGTTFLTGPAAAAALAHQINDYGAELTQQYPDRFGHFATLPMPDVERSAAEAARALDGLHADGVILLANAGGTYLGSPGQDPLFAVLDDRHAVAFVHPADLPGPSVPGIPPFATDFLLDTTRAAYLLVRNQVVRRYPNIRFILSHAGGFVPYAAHRMAMGIAGEDGTSIRDTLTGLRSFYYDTALSASPSALAALLAFAQPGRILYGSDWPFAPATAVSYFNAGLAGHLAQTPLSDAVSYGNAAALFPRFTRGAAVTPVPRGPVAAARAAIKDRAVRTLFALADPARG